MSYYEALEDSIRTEKDSRGFERYYPPCHICGASVMSWSYLRGTKYTCADCRELLIERQEDKKVSNLAEKQQRCLDRAIERISKMAKIGNYAKGIEWVKSNLGKAGLFQSTEEVMVALELSRRQVKAFHQVKVYNYSIDFVLPDYKVALEIDGKLYHGKDKQAYQAIRDKAICNKLGEGWQIIRIDTDCINMKITKLIPAIEAVLKRRRKVTIQPND